MGSKPSGVKGTVVAATVQGGDAAVCHVPKQAMTASAPPTPQRPDGAPRPDTAGDPFPPFSLAGVANGDAAPDSDLEEEPLSPLLPPPIDSPGRTSMQRATHTGTSSWATVEAGAADGGVGECYNADATLRFDAPLEKVLQQATEAFGSMASALSSPKWDRRVQALQGVGTVLKGLDIKAPAPPHDLGRGLTLRDGTRCFRAACLILNLALKDKVLPVLFAAHELYRITFEHGKAFTSAAESSFAMGVLLQHILGKLGETNIRLHQSACDAFVFSAGVRPFLSVQDGFSRLQNHLDECPLKGQQRMRVHAGVLDAVSRLMKRFPGRLAGEGEGDVALTWTASDVAPFVSAGMQVDSVTGTRVRQAAASLAVEVYTTVGKRSFDELLEQLPKASQEVVRSRIEEETGDLLEDGDEDEAGGWGSLDLCVTGVGIKLPTAPQKGELDADGQEENFMDEILEDAGMVFNGQGLSIHPKDSVAINYELDADLRNLGLLDGPMALS